MPQATVRSCRVCGCTEDDCSGCIERTGEPCYWVTADLCSACAPSSFSPTDAMHEIANRHSQACMAAIGREGVKGAAGWQFGMDPQGFIREAIMNALMDALAGKDPP
jgi:hypothetical protein